MALRHELPMVALPELRLESEPVRPPPMMRAAREVEFRPTADLDAVVESMTKWSRVKLGAAVGAGKSTVVPRLLAEKTNLPVLHAVPNMLLAVDQYDYLSPQFPGKYHLAVEDGDVIGEKGVTLTSYAWVTGMLLKNRDHPTPLGNVVLFADEIHESDCYSDFIRRLGTQIPGVKHFIESSATHDPAKMPMREPLGSAETRFFQRESPNTWNPSDVGKPWSVTGLDGNVLLVVDDEKTARMLVARYGSAGVEAYRLHSRMSVSDFRSAMKALRNPDGGLVALVAEYSFRNGFTFDITRIVDSALVKYVETNGRDMKVKYRPLYEIEKYQTMARGARTSGSKCVYYFPQPMEPDFKLCYLEGVEVEAAAVLIRMFGYSVPTELQGLAHLSSGAVPRNLASALRGFVPLVHLPDADLMDLVMPVVPKAEAEVVDLMDSYGFSDSPVAETANLFGGMDLEPKRVKPYGVAFNVLDELHSMSATQRVLEYGSYYSCAEARSNGAMGSVSWEDLLRGVLENPLFVHGLSNEMRNDAVARFLEQYNALMLHGAAASRVSAHKEQLTKLAASYPENVKKWTGWLANRSRVDYAMAVSLLKGIERLRTPAMNFVIVEADEKLEQEKAEELAAPLKAAVRQANAKVNSGNFFGRVRAIANGFGGELPELTEIEGPDDSIGGCSVAWRAVRVAGRNMHEVKLKPTNAMRWVEQDYVDAVRCLIDKKGVVASSISRLFIEGPTEVNCDRVMQMVRDEVGTYRDRTVVFSVRAIEGVK